MNITLATFKVKYNQKTKKYTLRIPGQVLVLDNVEVVKFHITDFLDFMEGYKDE